MGKSPAEITVGDFKDPAILAKWAKRSLYAYIAIVAMPLLLDMVYPQWLNGFDPVSYDETSAIALESALPLATFVWEQDDRHPIIAAITFVFRENTTWIFLAAWILLFVMAGFLVLKWIYRANRNAHALGARRMRFKPGWAVGWYFVPLANLWMPYLVMREIWKASTDPGNWHSQKVSPIVGWWWGAWIAGWAIVGVTVLFLLTEDSLTGRLPVNGLDIASSALDVLAAAMLVWVIGKITQMQIFQYGRLSGDS